MDINLPEHLKVLIVDDSQADADYYRYLLHPDSSEMLFQIDWAETGNEGMALTHQNNPDCILLDYELPDMDGIEFIKTLKADENRVPTAILMSTGNGDEVLAVEALKLGAADYIVKDKLNHSNLRRAIINAVEKTLLQREVLDKQEELELFAARLAHDLNAPLRQIKSFSDLLQQRNGNQLDADSQEYLEFIVDGVRYMTRLIESLREYTKYGRDAAQLEPVSLDEVVENVLLILDEGIQQSGATFEVDSLPVVLGDWVSLSQLIQNLIANSLKYHHPAKPPRIRITATKETAWVICVADNGIGIPAEFHQEIFSPFRRLHTRNESEGVGLGLATCRRIIEQHGGKIWVESVPEAGTSFFFTLQKVSDDPIDAEGHTP